MVFFLFLSFILYLRRNSRKQRFSLNPVHIPITSQISSMIFSFVFISLIFFFHFQDTWNPQKNVLIRVPFNPSAPHILSIQFTSFQMLSVLVCPNLPYSSLSLLPSSPFVTFRFPHAISNGYDLISSLISYLIQ